MPALGWGRVLTAGAGAAALVLALGFAAEPMVFGRTDAAAGQRVEREIRAHVAGVDTGLAQLGRVLAARPEVRDGVTGERQAVDSLFEVVRTTALTQPADLAITIYDARGAPRAWSGRPTELDPARVAAGLAGFAEAGPAGLRLVHVIPILESSPAVPDGTARRLGSAVVERVLSPPRQYMQPNQEFVLDTRIGSATVTAVGAGTRIDSAGPRFEVAGSDGRPLIAGVINLDEIARLRARWRARILGLFFVVLALTALTACGLTLARGGAADHLRRLLLAAGAAIAARGWLWLASQPGLFDLSLFSPEVYRSAQWPALLRAPIDLLLTAALGALLITVVADTVNRRRWASRTDGGRRPARPASTTLWAVGTTALVPLLLVGHQVVLRDTVAGTTLDLLHTAMQPFDTARVALQLALVLTSAATVWTLGLVFGASRALWPARPHHGRRWFVAAVCLAPAGLVVVAGWAPAGATLLTTALGLVLGMRWRRAITWFRHTDPLARVLAGLGAVLIPALPLYVSLVSLTDDAKRTLLDTGYAVQVAEHPQEIQRELRRTLEQIDTFPDLPALTASGAGDAADALDTDRAFGIWRQTALAASRLTSAVELYGPGRNLTSRFALNVPEYAVTASRWTGTGCEWEVFGEAAPFGSEERRMLHAERGLCEPGPDGVLSPAGAVVVHVAQVDYESLPFISSRSPYVELFEAGPAPPPPGAPGHEIELVIYGWGLQPTFVSSRTAWVIDDDLFRRIYASRAPFWTRLAKDSTVYEVLLTNNQAGIYALGYPVHTLFDHLLHLSEIAILVIAVFGLLLVAIGAAGLVFPAPRRQLAVREVRARFALKLQLWFLAVATAPVVAAAVLIQGYFTDQLRADVEAGAARTAAVAQSVIEESAVLQPADGQIISPFTDDVLVWISQVVGQDVNIFDGPRLVATSERDLYASGLLPTRTPDMVYRAIALEQLPSFVGEDAIGPLRYQLAAAPVRAAGRNAILTVPLASRQREIESQIDELNRRIWGAALFFAALVGFIGWGIARNIAGPVRRLTHATSRVARGAFHPPGARRTEVLRKRVADRSADELEVLESAFNNMAAELDTQRRQLERTHRLEAWTEMARQVAHEIKNPLTPVQLSAEHLLRVHADRGAPLSPVLQECVTSILKQVRILRQIASEFSSYASSPTADRQPTALGALIEDIVGPYRPGLEGRIRLTADMPPGLPALRLDRVLMRRALTNIIENALHAMPGEGALSIQVVRHPPHLLLQVTDTGVGLEPDVLARIFEPYFSTKVTGTGLGMAIAKRNVELNGGAIAVASEPGRGTTVTITLPEPAAAAPPQAPHPDQPPLGPLPAPAPDGA